MSSTVEIPATLLRRHRRYLLGQPHMVTPRLVDEVFGDGQQVIGLMPLDTRPNYYIVRIDSGWSLDNSGPEPLFCYHLDDLYVAIEDQFGRGTGPRGGYIPFPALHDDCGASWFAIEMDAASEAPAQRRGSRSATPPTNQATGTPVESG